MTARRPSGNVARMDSRRREPEREVLPEKVGERLLRRASELDVANRSGAEVARLRAAAAEAGISNAAFDAALAELREEQSAPVATEPVRQRSRSPVWAIVVGAIAILLAGVITMRTVVPVPPTPLVQWTFAHPCLSAEQAMALVRPLLQDGKSTVQTSPSSAPGVITIRTTPAQLERVRELLRRQDAAGAQCVTPQR